TPSSVTVPSRFARQAAAGPGSGLAAAATTGAMFVLAVKLSYQASRNDPPAGVTCNPERPLLPSSCGDRLHARTAPVQLLGSAFPSCQYLPSRLTVPSGLLCTTNRIQLNPVPVLM